MSDAHRDGQAAARHAAVIAELLARVQAEVTGAAALVDVAEDEIEQAAARHRRQPTTCSTLSACCYPP